MSFIPRPQEIYKHFKGNLYQVVTVAEHTETGKLLVVYQAMYGDFKTYARELEMFTSRVDREKYPDAAQEFRFELQGPDSGRQIRESGPAGGTGKWEEPKDSPEKAERPASGTGGRQEPAGGDEKAERSGRSQGSAAGIMAAADTGGAQKDSSVSGGGTSAAQESSGLDPMVEQFLDADSYEEKLNLLAGLHHRITQDMVTTMAVASDIEVEDGELEDRYQQLKNCLLTLEKYECKRLN